MRIERGSGRYSARGRRGERWRGRESGREREEHKAKGEVCGERRRGRVEREGRRERRIGR